VRPGIVDALGFADPSASRAHVIYDRVQALTARSQLSAASLLGDVIPQTRTYRSRHHAVRCRRARPSNGDLYWPTGAADCLRAHSRALTAAASASQDAARSGRVNESGELIVRVAQGGNNGTTRTVTMNQPNDRTTYRS
jgi:hypothetical protein